MERTLLSNLEQFIRFPGDHTSSKSAPAPFHDAAENLENLAELESAGILNIPEAQSSAALERDVPHSEVRLFLGLD